MCFELHSLQLVPLVLFGLYCLKKFIDSKELFEIKVVVLTIILSIAVLVLIFSGFSEYGGGGYHSCTVDFSNIEQSDNQGDDSWNICF